jgi:hypothetical protein
LLNRRPEIGAAKFRLIASNRAECAYLFFFVYEAHQTVDDTAFPAKWPKGRTRRNWLLDMERSWKTIEQQRNEGISPCQQSKGSPCGYPSPRALS